MSKKVVQDIYVVKKSIRLIKKSDVRDSLYGAEKHNPISEKVDDGIKINKAPINEEINDSDIFEEKKHVSKDSLMILWTICILSIGTLVFFLSSYFATASLYVTPKSQSVTLDDTYTAYSTDKNNGSLFFETVTIKKNATKTVETDGQKDVQLKAIGKATIYNNYSASSQRLVNNTRLETKDGLVYRIRNSVVVPGIKTVNGEKVPGSVEIEIIADVAGEKYNMKVSDLKGDFTIPGFKGDPRYNYFYARLSADLTGGFVGEMKTVSEEKLKIEKEALTEVLRTDLIKEIYSKTPEKYILFKDNYYLQCTNLPDDFMTGDYKISKECSLHSILFNRDVLSDFIAKNKIEDFDDSTVDVIWGEDTGATISGGTEKPWNEESIKIRFTGVADVVWRINTEEILHSVLGQDKSIAALIVEDNKNSIEEITASIRPVWRGTFPEKTNKIKIIDTIRNIEK
jgi:hypothetical protein